MSSSPTVAPDSALAPFRVRSFCFQWPADLAASWAFEMETLILGWYVLVESGSVKLLVLFGALQYLGSLFSPLFGVAADRVGYRLLLLCTRAIYAGLALLLGVLAAYQALTPLIVLIIAAVAGTIRPSDMMLRNALIAQTMPAGQLLGALGVSRVTSDSARIAGALAGAGAVAVFGIAQAYAAVTLLFLVSFGLSLGVARHESGNLAPSVATASPLQDLCSAFRYVWSKPDLLGAMTLAFLVNLLAFPFVLGLLPYVAKNVYGVGQTGLGLLVAGFSAGALSGSIVLGANRFALRAARTMLIAAGGWFAALLIFAFVTRNSIGIATLVCAGFAQSLCLTPLAAVMLRGAAPEYRGRVMGMRMLAVWGLPAGLLISGPLIDAVGFTATTVGYASLGLVATAAMTWRWRADLWCADAPANLAAAPTKA
jgi:predicted MFS family arabinose efflux permease